MQTHTRETLNVKKYTAATTREALEQIKKELGEDALVLETKQVRKGGFLGFGHETVVEMSAAKAFAAAGTSAASLGMLDISDSTPATPGSIADSEGDSLPAFLKAFTDRDIASKRPLSLGTALPRLKPVDIDAVEVSTSAPRIVHPKKAKVAAETATEAEVAAPASLNQEIAMLRAELREVKFAIGSIANRREAPKGEASPNAESFAEELESPFYEAFMELTERGVSAETAREVILESKETETAEHVDAPNFTRAALVKFLQSLSFDASTNADDPQITAIIGATGVGKTTTIAKLAARKALYDKKPVELVTLDTYRIAAVEQLKTYAEIIGARCHVVQSIFELDAVLRRFPADANVFIDTTGRNPHDLADQFEVSDYLGKRKEIRKCLAMQATMHPLDAFTTIKKFEMYGADSLAITKMDETLRPGAMIDLARENALPLVYLCAGQRVPEDLSAATPEAFADLILG